ncbi:hypothetical protein PHLCEN_2v12632 [Hermanssonia centrifuga]|uniref:Uncharacterized protein n=1 Tax=Hermanssonia centrifuga TaxID=98765 RepID=A0A2R6NHM8_9APHY|nr:hypothetical protein PHLCEN_2v12632 [Hermanssonia centrifuga]
MTLEKLEDDISEGILGSGKLSQWRAEEAEWLTKVVNQETHKTLDNPYEPKKETRLTQKQALAEIGAAMLSSSVVSAGLLGVLEEGIGLQEARSIMLLELDVGANSDVSMKTLQDLRSNWERDVESWRGRDAIYLTPLVQEAVKALDERSRTTALQSGAERGSLEAFTNGAADPDSSDDEKANRPTSEPASESKRKRGMSGRKPEKARPAMASELLAMRIDLPSSLHPIIRKHPAMKAAVDMEMGLREHQATGYCQTVLRGGVHWFRCNALKTRWSEQSELLPEEMRRTVRFFEYHKAEWRNKAEAEDARDMPGNAAYARRQVHDYERFLDGCRRAFEDVPGVDVDVLIASPTNMYDVE